MSVDERARRHKQNHNDGPDIGEGWEVREQKDERPEPLISTAVDLRGYEFMPLYGDRLFKSTTWIKASAEGKVAALRLWYHAFTAELPAATLPTDDNLLADYAGYGVAIKAWKRIRSQALRGWTECSDGRLYHGVLCEIAVEAMAKRHEFESAQDGKKTRTGRHRRERSVLFDCLRKKGVHLPFNVSTEELRAVASRNGCAVTGGTASAEPVTGDGEPATGSSHARGAVCNGYEVEVDSEVESSTLLNRDVGVHAGPEKVNGAEGKKTEQGPGQEWNSANWVAGTARRLDVTRRNNESDELFRDRVYAELQAHMHRSRTEWDKRQRRPSQ